mmetsp:Transcript_15084/g.50933  ORF Transcript_15084/g.50933 Transcript_15084/m.50933 type:complete len:277 (-) Transcript_15084:1180-2010(-)
MDLGPCFQQGLEPVERMRRVYEPLAVVWPIREEGSIDPVGADYRLLLSIVRHLIGMITAHCKRSVDGCHEVLRVPLSVLSVMEPHVTRPCVPSDVNSILMVPPDHKHARAVALVVCPEGVPFDSELVLPTRVFRPRVRVHHHLVALGNELPASKDHSLVRSSHPLQHLGRTPVIGQLLEVLSREDHHTLEGTFIVAARMGVRVSDEIGLEPLAIEPHLSSQQGSFQGDAVVVLSGRVEDTNHLVDPPACIDRLQPVIQRHLEPLEDTLIAGAGQRA